MLCVLCLIALITSRRSVINQQQSALSRPWTLLPERIQAGSLAVHFAQIGRLPVDIPTLPATLPLSSEIARAWAACAREHKGIVCCAWLRRLFRNNRRWHPSQGHPPNLATRRAHQRLIDPTGCSPPAQGTAGFASASVVGRTRLSPTEGARSASAILLPFPLIQPSSCSGDGRDGDPALKVTMLVTNSRL